jgi:hypothetical protein
MRLSKCVKIFLLMRSVAFFAILRAQTQAIQFCPASDIDRMGGGKGFYEMLMTCGHLKDLKHVEECTVNKFQSVAMSDSCGRCVADFLVDPEHANQTHMCSLSCNRNDPDCEKCKSDLGNRWESRCKRSSSPHKQLL